MYFSIINSVMWNRNFFKNLILIIKIISIHRRFALLSEVFNHIQSYIMIWFLSCSLYILYLKDNFFHDKNHKKILRGSTPSSLSARRKIQRRIPESAIKKILTCFFPFDKIAIVFWETPQFSKYRCFYINSNSDAWLFCLEPEFSSVLSKAE